MCTGVMKESLQSEILETLRNRTAEGRGRQKFVV